MCDIALRKMLQQHSLFGCNVCIILYSIASYWLWVRWIFQYIWHAIIDRYRYLFFISYSLYYSKSNTTYYIQDKMYNGEKKTSSVEWNWKNVILLCSLIFLLLQMYFFFSLLMLLNQRLYRNSIEYCYDNNMNDIHSNEMLEYIPFHLQLKH